MGVRCPSLLAWDMHTHAEAMAGPRGTLVTSLSPFAGRMWMLCLLFKNCPVLGWLGKHPEDEVLRIQSSLLEPQRWRSLEMRAMDPLCCARHQFNLAALTAPCCSLPNSYRQLCGDLPAVSAQPPAALSPWLFLRLEGWNFPPCICPEDCFLSC